MLLLMKVRGAPRLRKNCIFVKRKGILRVISLDPTKRRWNQRQGLGSKKGY
jgi:ribosomal protein L36